MRSGTLPLASIVVVSSWKTYVDDAAGLPLIAVKDKSQELKGNALRTYMFDT